VEHIRVRRLRALSRQPGEARVVDGSAQEVNQPARDRSRVHLGRTTLPNEERAWQLRGAIGDERLAHDL